MSKLLITDSKITDIADAIRSKTSAPTGTKYTLAQMADAINGITLGHLFTQADEGKVVSNGALVAQTSQNISANGTYDTTLKNEAIVNVPNSYSSSDEGKVVSNGALVAQTSKNISSNGTYDTTENNEVVVAVESGNTAGGGGGSDGWKILQNPNFEVLFSPRPSVIARAYTKRQGYSLKCVMEGPATNRSGCAITFDVNGVKDVKVDFDYQTDSPNTASTINHYASLSTNIVQNLDNSSANYPNKPSDKPNVVAVDLPRDNNKNHISLLLPASSLEPFTKLCLFVNTSATGCSTYGTVVSNVISSLTVRTLDISTALPNYNNYDPNLSSLIADWSDFSVIEPYASSNGAIDGSVECEDPIYLVLRGNSANYARIENGHIAFKSRSEVHCYGALIDESVVIKFCNEPYIDDLATCTLTNGYKRLCSPYGDNNGLFWRLSNDVRRWMFYGVATPGGSSNWYDLDSSIPWLENPNYFINKEIGWRYYHDENQGYTRVDLYVDNDIVFTQYISNISPSATNNFFIIGDDRNNACINGLTVESVKLYRGNIFEQNQGG